MQGGRLSLPELEFGLGAMEMKPSRWLRCTREARMQHLTIDLRPINTTKEKS